MNVRPLKDLFLREPGRWGDGPDGPQVERVRERGVHLAGEVDGDFGRERDAAFPASANPGAERVQLTGQRVVMGAQGAEHAPDLLERGILQDRLLVLVGRDVDRQDDDSVPLVLRLADGAAHRLDDVHL